MTDATHRLVVGFAQELSAAAGSNPKAVFDAASFLITRQIFEAPFFPPLDATQDATPKLFTGPLQADAERPGRAFHATIREDLKFSDGTPFEPRHLVSSLGESTNLSRDVRVTIDGTRVSFELAAPNPRFELQLAAQPLVSLADRSRQRRQRASGVIGAIGTGAYRIVTASSSELVLGRNEHHPEPPPIAEVVFRSYPPDDRGRPRALLAALEPARWTSPRACRGGT